MDSINITYLWDTVKRELRLYKVTPQELQPYLETWKREERKDGLEENNVDKAYISSYVVLRAYYAWKKQHLAGLSSLLTNQQAIQELEEWYNSPWKNILYNWGEKHSFISYHFEKN